MKQTLHLFLVMLFSLAFSFTIVAQTPTIEETLPESNFVGESFCFDINISNNSPNVGFGPYLRLVIPSELEFESMEFFGGGNIIVDEVFSGSPIEDPLTMEEITGTSGHRLVIFELPVGSIVQGGPSMITEVCLAIQPSSPIGIGIPIDITPVFRFGDTATGDNGPIIGNTQSPEIIPVLYTYEKIVRDFQGERPPGPAWTMEYDLIVDIANTGNINDLSFTDILPNNLQFVEVVGISGSGQGCQVIQEPSTTEPGGTITATCASATGSTNEEDVVVTYRAYIIDILDHDNCGTRPVENNSEFITSSTPDRINEDEEITIARHVTLQKNVSPEEGKPDDLVQYAVNFQVSDYDEVDGLVITDVAPDGVSVDINSVTLTVAGQNIPANFNIQQNTPSAGRTTIITNVHNDYLLATGNNLVGPISGSITYNATVDQQYDADGRYILASDQLNDNAGLVYSTIDGANNCSIQDGAPFTILPVEVRKSLAASTSSPFQPGDQVIYRLELDIPSGDADNIEMQDFFPLPILDLTKMGFTPNIGTSGNIRPITGGDFLGTTPSSATIDAATNSLIITFPNIHEASGNKIGVEVEVNVVDEPFADDLFHSNIVLAKTSNTEDVIASDVALNLIKVFAPNLLLTKGIVETDNPNATVEPNEVPVNGDAIGVDAGDRITYQTTIFNDGGAIAYDVLVKDVIPAELSNCTLVSVTQGNGTTPISTSGDLFGAGMMISQLAGDDGADNNGPDMALIRYNCNCTTAVQPKQEIINTASVTWASQPGATPFPAVTEEAKVTIGSPELFKFVEKIQPRYAGDDTRVQIGDTVYYVLNLIVPEGTNANVTINDKLSTGLGLIAVDEVIAPTGVTTSIGGGFATIAATEPTNGQNITLDFGTITNTNDDNAVEDFITIKYRAEVLNVNYNGQNINTTTGIGRALRNEAQLFYDGNQTNNVRTTVRIVESIVDITKTFTSSNNPNAMIDADGNITEAMAGDVVTYNVTITNTGAGSMVDAKLFDEQNMLRNCILNDLVDQDGVPVPHTISNDTIIFTNPISGESSIMASYTCEVIPSVNPGQLIDNNATIFYDPMAGQTEPSAMSDNATIKIVEPKIAKSKITIVPNYSGNLDEVQIGEIITYQVVIDVPRGTSNNVIFEDILDAGLAFVAVDEVTASANVSTTATGDFAGMPANAVIAAEGNGTVAEDRKVTIDFGTLRNTDEDNATIETITITYRAMVLNTTSNIRGQELNNTANWLWDDPNAAPNTTKLAVSNSEKVTVIEPELQVTTTFTNEQIDLEDETFVILTISHTDASNGDAKDINLVNELPFGLLFIDGSFNTTCPTVPTFAEDTSPASGGTVTASFEDLPLGTECEISYRAKHDPAAAECDDLNNCATVEYESLGDVDQGSLETPPNNQFGAERTGDLNDPGQLNNYEVEGCGELQITNGLTADPFISATTPVCENGRAIFTNETEYQGNNVVYQWFGPDGEIENDNFQLIIDPVSTEDAGSYYTIVTVDGCNTESSNRVNLAVDLLPTTPTASAGNNGVYCAGENVQLFANAENGVDYLWTGPNGYSSTAQNPIIINASTLSSGDYFVEVTNADGCTSEASNNVSITINPQPQPLSISNDSPVCTDGTSNVTLVAENVPNGAEVQWYNGDGDLMGTGNNFVLENVTAADAGSYYAILSISGCASEPSATTEVVVDEIPAEVAFAGDDQDYCTGVENITLAATAPTSGTGMWSVMSENGGAVIVSPMNPQSSVTGLQSGTYTFVWTLSNGTCNDYSSDEMTVQIGGNLAAPTASNDGAACVGSNIALLAENVPDGATIEWTGPNGYTSTAIDPILENVQSVDAGDYRVRYMTADGCTSAFSEPTTVEVLEGVDQPTLFSNAPICDGEQLELTATFYNGISSYQWYGPEGGNPTLNTDIPKASVPSFSNAYINGDWRVQITGTNGCVSELSEPLTIEIKEKPTAPTATVQQPVCAGGDINLQASPIGGATYNWEGPNTFSSAFQNPVISNADSDDSGTYRVSVTVEGCTSDFAEVAVAVAELPTATPTNNGGACGQSLQFFANAAGGSGNYTYQWTGPNNFSSTAEKPVIDNPGAANEGSYSVIVTDSNTGCSSAPGVTQVSVVSSQTFQPTISGNDPICAGERLALNTLEINGNSVNYEWSGPNSTSTSGGDYANAPSLIINNVQVSNAGDYTVSVTVDGCASTPSETYTVIVNEQPTLAPSSSLTGSTCADGSEDVMLFANPSASNIASYEWQGPADFTSVAQDPTITNATSNNSGIYTVIATDVNGCVSEKEEISLVINDQPATPVISPVTSSVCAGENFTVTVPLYDGVATYNWALDGNPIGNNTNSIVVEEATETDAGVYTISVTINNCTSETASMEVAISESPVVTLEDQDAGCAAGSGDYTIVASVTGGATPYTYDWIGPNGFTSAAANPVIPNAGSDDAGTYSVVVTDANGCTSVRQSAVLTINDQPQQPTFSSTGTVCAGEPLELMVQSYSGTNVTYNWTKDGVALDNSSNIYFVNPTTATDAGVYEVTVVIGTCASETSSITVQINDGIEVAVDNQDIPCTNGTETLTLTAQITGGNAPFTYTWTGPNGFSSVAAEPTINNVSAINSGTYTLQVTDNQGCTSPANSGVITVTDALSEPLITKEGGECVGEMVTLSVRQYDGNNVTYDWLRDGVSLDNDNPILTINPTTTESIGSYQVTVTVDGCSINSDAYILELQTQPEVSIAAVEPLACTDGTADITLDATPANPDGNYTYSWTGPNDFTSTAQDAIITNADAAKAGTYILTMTDASGCASAETSVVVDITDATTQPMITASGAACEGEAITLTATAYNGASVTYNWTADGVALATTGNEVILDPVSTTDDVVYMVEVSVDGCTNTSAGFRPTIYPSPTVTVADIPEQACTDGTKDIVLDATPEAAADPLEFAWTGPNGFTASGEDVLLPNAGADDAGTYTVILTDGNGCTSAPASVTLSLTDALDQPVIASTGNVCVGDRVTLSIPAYTGANVDYVWQRDGVTLDVNNNQLIFEPTQATDRGTYRVTVTVDGCSTTSEDFFLDIFLSPTVEILPLADDATECTSDTDDLILDAEANGGTGSYRYIWTGPNGFNSTDENPTLFNITADKSGTYEVYVVDTRNCESTPATIDLDITDAPERPVITSSGPTCLGGRIVLSAQTYSGSDLTYTWSRDGINLNNNSNVLVIDPVQAEDDGVYLLTVGRSGCNTSSQPFQIEFYTPPTLEVPTFPDFECVDGEAGLTLSATADGGSGTYRYAWTGPNDFQSNVRLPELDPLTADKAGTYRVFVEDSNGCPSEEREIQLNVTEQIKLPQLLTSGPACIGGDVTFEVEEYEGEDVTYEWFKDEESLPFTTRSFMLSNVGLQDGGVYQIRVTVDGCTDVSPKYLLEIYDSPNVTIGQPTGTISCVRGTESYTFDLDVDEGAGPYIFRWSGPNDFRSTLQNPTLNNLNSSLSGTYTVLVRDQNQCFADEASVEVTFQDAPDQPVIVSNREVCEGEPTTLEAQSYTGGTVEYFWSFNGDPIENNSNILNINSVTQAETGDYTMRVVVDGCESDSDLFTLNAFENPSVTITTPPSFECTSGTESYTFEAIIEGGEPPYNFQWIGVNGFSSTLVNPTISNLNESFSGTYTLQITDANGCTTGSISTELVITDGLAQPTLTSSGPACPGDDVTFTIPAYQGANVNYVWTRNGQTIENNSNQLVVNAVEESDEGSYTVTATVDGCMTTSTAQQLVVLSVPQIVIDPVEALTCTDGTQEIALNASVTSTDGDLTYAWSGPNDFTSAIEDPVLSNVDASFAGTYSLMVFNSNGCVTAPVSIEIVVDDGLAQPALTANGPVCAGESVTLSIPPYEGANVTYTWTRDGEVIDNNSNQLNINPSTTADAGEYLVMANVDGCATSSNTLDLVIYSLPQVSIAEVAETGCASGTTSIQLDATIIDDNNGLTYSWTGPNGFTSTIEDPVINNVTADDAGTYVLQVSNANGCSAESVSVDVVITDGLSQPTITANAPICAGEAAMLSINEYAGNNVLYTWTKDGVNLNNNNNTLPINPSTTNDAGAYMVSVTADGCETTSEVYDFVVYDLPQASIVQPEAQACVNDNSSVTLDATPTNGNGFYTYAWTGPNNFTSTQQDPTLVNLSEADAGTYTLVVTDGNGCAAPAVSTVLNITENIPQPVITSSGNACAGGELTLEVREYEGSNVTYEWTRDGALIDNNSNILTINPATAANSGDYQVTVTVGECTSSSTLRAIQIFESPEVIIEIPPSFSCTDGTQDYTFVTTVNGGSGNYTYAWSGPDGFESALATPTIFDVDENSAGTYNLVVSDENNCRSAVASAQLAVDSALEQPFISASNDAICTNSNITLSIPAYSGTNVAYTWTKDGVDVENNANELIINNITTEDIGSYEVLVIVNDCSATSNPYQLDLQPQATVTIDPVDAINCASNQTDIPLNATVTNAPGEVTYNWTGPNGFRSTVEDPILNNIDASFAGTYVLEVNTGDGCTNVTQSVAVEITEALPQPIITGTGADCAGETAVLEVENYEVAGVSFNWFYNGNPLNNTSNRLVINSLDNQNAGDYTVVVSKDDCSTTSATYALEVFAAPSVSIANVAPMNCTSGTNNMTLDATAVGGSGNYTYLWSGPNGYSSTQEDPQIVNIDESKAGTYQVVVNDENGCESATASVVVDITDATPQPVIAYSGDVCAGESITLQVETYEGANVTYQWTVDGEVITNNSNVLTIATTTVENSGEYAVRVNSDGCAATSATQTVQIFANPTLAIATPPTFGCTDGTQDYTFEVTIDGNTEGLTYNWTGPDGFNSTLATPTVTDLNESKAGTYNLVITTPNGCTSATTSAELLINDALVQPMITTSDNAICNNGTVTLAIAAYEGTNVSYVWTKDGVDLNNNSNQLTINNVNADDAGSYDVSVNVNDCTSSATPYQLTLQPQATVTIDPVDAINCASNQTDIPLNATVTNAPGEVTYNWTGPNGFRSTLEDPTLTNIDASFAGTYVLEVNTGDGCPNVSQSVAIEITEALPQPIITGSGADCAGETAVLEVENYEVSGVSFNWFYNGTAINNTSNRLVINSLDNQNAGEYTVIVSKDDCSTTSAIYALEVFAAPSVSIANVAPMNCTSGTNNMTLDATAVGGSGNYTYLWSGPNGYSSTQEDPQIVNIDESKAGTYQVLVNDENGCESATASVVVDITDATPQPVIAYSGDVCAGESITLQVETYEGATVTYQWTVDGEVITNNSNVLTIATTTVENSGEYAVRVNADGCAATSATQTVQIFANPTLAIATPPTFGCTDGTQDYTFEVTINGNTEGLTYNWTGPNGFNSTLATPTVTDLNESKAGTYNLVVTTPNGCTSATTSAELIINDNLPQPTITGSGAACAGETAVLEVENYAVSGVSFNWFYNGTNINNSSNRLVINSLSNQNAGNYTVTVSKDDCSATSAEYILGVFATPMVTIDNIAPMNCTTGTNNLTLNATVTSGSGSYAYAWTGPNDFFSAQEDPQIVNIDESKAGTYQVIVTDENGCASATASVVVDITDATPQPVINSSGATCTGGDVTLSVTPYDGANVRYRWSFNGTVIQEGGTELILLNIDNEQAGDYTLEVNADGCTATSTPMTVEVFDAPQISIGDVAPTFCTAGDSDITLSPNIEGGTAPFTYEWTGPNNFYSVNAEPVLINADASMDGSYTLRITDGNNCISNAATIEIDITDAIIQPNIIASKQVCAGEEVTLSVQEYEGVDVRYEWLKDNEPYANITNNEININPVDTTDEGAYQVIVTVDGCSNTSTVYNLEVYRQPEAIVEVVASTLCSDGTGDVQLNGSATGGNGNYTYQWRGPNGFNSTLEDPTILNATDENTGTYTLFVSDTNGCSSDVASVEVEITDALTYPIINSTGNVCAGDVVTLSVPFYNLPNVQYEWRRNDELLTNTGNILTLRPASIAQNGDYTVRVITPECDVLSDIYTLEIVGAPVVEIDPISPMNCTTGINNLTIDATVTGGSGDYTYEWTGPNDYFSTQEDPQIVNINATKSGTYHLLVTDANGCQSTRESVVIDITDGIETPVIISSGATCEGGQVILEIEPAEGSFVSYFWRTPEQVTENILGLNSNRIIINPVDATHLGEYRVEVTANGCREVSGVYTLETLEQPVASPFTFNTEVCPDDELELFANVQGEASDYTYRWEGPAGFVSNLANPVIDHVEEANNGEYQLTVSNGNGCSTTEFMTVDNVKAAPEVPTLSANAPLCEGETLVLFTDVNAASFEWVGPLGGNEGTLQLTGLRTEDNITTLASNSPAYLSGEWQVRSVDTNGCKSELSAPLTIDISEVPEAIATKSSDVCPGESVQLFANEVENASYRWVVAGTGTVISTEQNPVISNLNNTITYQLEIEKNGCRSDVSSITVFAEAEPTANPNANYNLNADCSPSNLTLVANANGSSNNFSYNWTGPNGFTSSAENPVIANAGSENNGAYELTITNESGCTATFVTEVISIIEDEIAQPIITGSEVTCRGGVVTLSVPQYNAAEVTYRWRRNGSQIPTSTSNELVINNIQEEHVGIYTVTVGVNDCLLQSNEYTVVINEQPEIAPEFSLSNNCEGGVLTLNANATAGQNLTYQWRGPNGFTSTAASTTLNNTNVNQNGGYTLTAFAENGCSTTEEIFIDAIMPNPVQPQIVGTETICAGSDIRLQTANNYTTDIDYIWLNAFGQIIGTDSILTIASDAAEAISPYRLRLEENGCFSTMSDAIEVTTVNPPTAIINANEGYCTGEDAQVFANSINGASYEWRHAFTDELLSTDQNPIFYNLTDDLPLELTVKVDGCTQIAEASTRLEVNDPPTILQIVGNSDVCEGSLVTLSTSISNGGGQDITYRWTGPNGFTFMQTVSSGQPAALSLDNVTRSMAGSYTLTATTESGCESDTESIFLTINTLPTVPTLSVSDNVVCQNGTIQLDATPYTGGNDALYEWSYDDGTGAVLINVTSQSTLFLTNVTPDQSGNYSVRIQTGDCESASSNSVAVEVYGIQDAVQAVNSSSLETPACAGDMVQLSVPFFAEATYQWYGPNGFTANIHNPVISPVTASSVGDYFAVLNLDGCATVVAQSTTVYVNPTPDAPTITSNANNGNAVCPDTDITLRVSSSLNFLPNDVLSFEWYDALTNELLGVTDTSVFDLPNISQTSDFYVIMTFNECTAVQSAPTTVNIIELPENVFAFAGVDQEICASSRTTLSATELEEGVGIWTSPTGATIFEPTSANTEVADLQEGENIFVWSISTGFCGVAATDTMRVTVAEMSTDIAVAGFDINVCGENTTLLNATTPVTATGRWTQPDSQVGEGVKIVDPMNPQTEVTGLKEGAEYTFTWSLSQGDCEDFQSDEVRVSVAARPLSTAFIEKDEIYTCGDENVMIVANTPQSASGRWTTDSGATIVEAGSSSSLVTNLPMGMTSFIWTLSNGACQSYSSDTLMVFSEAIPVAFPENRNVEFNSDPIDIDVIANDELTDVEEFAIRITNFPDHGQVINNGDGTLTYQVDENYAGTDSLVYELCNANCEDLCSEATVMFNISGVDFANDCFIFNIMTPNGDGSNDALFVSCAEQFPNNEIKVFNRWGDLVFEANGYINNWEAIYQNKPLPAGTYYYLFKRDASFEAAEQGYITIFR